MNAYLKSIGKLLQRVERYRLLRIAVHGLNGAIGEKGLMSQGRNGHALLFGHFLQSNAYP